MLFVFLGVFNLILWVKPSKSNFGKYGKSFSLILKGNLIDFEILFFIKAFDSILGASFSPAY